MVSGNDKETPFVFFSPHQNGMISDCLLGLGIRDVLCQNIPEDTLAFYRKTHATLAAVPSQFRTSSAA